MGACKEFYFGFFDDMDAGLRDRITEAVHDYRNPSVEELTETYENIIKDIEKSHGANFFVGHIVVREFALLLNKREGKSRAINFLKRRQERIGIEDDFHTLMTLSSLYEKNGEYELAIEVLERAKNMISAGDNLMMALTSLKLASDHWNFMNKSAESYGYQNKGMNLLNDLRADFDQLTSPSTERGMMFVDSYKTASYLYGIQHNYRESANCYEDALGAMRKSRNSKLHHLKGLSQLCKAKAAVGGIASVAATIFLQTAEDIADELCKDEEIQKAHIDSITHILSRLAHSHNKMKQLDKSLEIRLKALHVMKTFFGETHPEVARMSADVALNYYLLKNRDKCDEYILTAEDILRSCGYKEDVTKAKLYFREISDTLRILANLFAMMSEYGDSEEHYKRALDLHQQVYGWNHQRTARVYWYLGNLYKQWKKRKEAVNYLNRAIEIHKLYLPASADIMKKINKDLLKAANLKAKKSDFGRFGLEQPECFYDVRAPNLEPDFLSDRNNLGLNPDFFPDGDDLVS